MTMKPRDQRSTELTPSNLIIFLTVGVFLLGLIILLAGCQPDTPPQAGSTTTPQPTGDSTAYIQSQLDKNKYFYVDRNYIVDGTITPPNGSVLEFNPNGQFTRTADAPLIGTLPVILLEKSNIQLKNPRITGPNPCYWTYFQTGYKYSQYDPKREWNHAISIMGGENYLIDNPVLYAVWGDAINIDRGPKNITINNLNATCVGRSIISNTGSTGVRVNGGNVSGAFWWTFNIEPFGSRVVRNYTVSNVYVGFSRGQAIFSGGPDFNCQVYDVTFNGLIYTTSYSEASIQSCVQDEIVIK